MPPKPKSAPISSHPFPPPANRIPRQTTPIKSTPIITKTPIVSGPTTILPPKLPNTTPISQPKPIIIPTTTPYSNTPTLTSSNLPNTTPQTTQDNTLTYVILGALVVGFIILQNKDI
jgi:hypothetical protein